jgi:hypothetical protein
VDFGLSLSPLVSLPLLIGLGALALVAIIALVVLRPRGALLRGVALTLLFLAVANPSLNREDRERLPGVTAIVVDRSASQNFDGRRERTDAALAEVEQRARALPGMEVRIIEGGAPGTGSDGTELFKSLQAGLADVPPNRVAGAVFITDGIVHDVPAEAAALGFTAPVHALLTGQPGERDRRVVLTAAPRFGIVDRTQTVRFRVEDRGIEPATPVGIIARRDGEEIARSVVMPGTDASVEVPIGHAGPNVVEIEAAAAENELTLTNNRVALQIQGVREKLRVLLVSGEPHSGERTWRNLLKADANVDLVHFTILRPPEKQDGTPINELSLIAFPTRELFVTRIDDFDLIIFDRYARQGILPMLYFDNIAEYVRRGGAVLVAAGADYAGPGSLSETPLGSVLPAQPLGGVLEQPFKPQVSDTGKRHPVTRALPGDTGATPSWSNWFRMADAEASSGTTIMTGVDDKPLLVLSREDEGRVATLLSDHAWLWARGFEGGGPHLDLLRRLSHWLMKEPDLEEEALRLRARGGTLVVERQTMPDTPPEVTLTLPSGESRRVTLGGAEPGLFRAELDTGETGLHRAEDGTFTALINVGTANPREFQEVVSTPDHLEPIAQATGGTVRNLLAERGGEADIPRLLAVSGTTRAYGSDWIGVRQSEASVVRGLSIFPLLAGFAGLFLLIGALAAAWAREGR